MDGGSAEDEVRERLSMDRLKEVFWQAFQRLDEKVWPRYNFSVTDLAADLFEHLPPLYVRKEHCTQFSKEQQ